MAQDRKRGNANEENEQLGIFTARLILTGQQKEERTETAYDESSIASFMADETVDKNDMRVEGE